MSDELEMRALMEQILFISNGQGEDSIASGIIQELPRELRERVLAVPLVGDGAMYELSGVPAVSFVHHVRSSGVKGWPLFRTLTDLLSGDLIRTLSERRSALMSLKEKVSLAVAVGDVYPLFMALTLKVKVIFIGTAKSVRVEPYNFLERYLMRRCARVFVRDEETATELRRRGVSAEFVGNPMLQPLEPLDTLNAPHHQLIKWFSGGELRVTLLPGRWEEALSNLELQLRALGMLSEPTVRALVVIPPSYPLSRVEELVRELGREQVKVATSELLGDALKLAHLVLGQAGTANEQAAALGKPIIAFDRSYPNISWYRWRQVRLLRRAVKVLPAEPESIASFVSRLLSDEELYSEMSEAGRKAMGPPGGASAIARAITEEFIE